MKGFFCSWNRPNSRHVLFRTFEPYFSHDTANTSTLFAAEMGHQNQSACCAISSQDNVVLKNMWICAVPPGHFSLCQLKFKLLGYVLKLFSKDQHHPYAAAGLFFAFKIYPKLQPHFQTDAAIVNGIKQWKRLSAPSSRLGFILCDNCDLNLKLLMNFKREYGFNEAFVDSVLVMMGVMLPSEFSSFTHLINFDDNACDLAWYKDFKARANINILKVNTFSNIFTSNASDKSIFYP